MKAQLRKAIPAILALFSLNAAAVTRYVDLNCTNSTPPYTNWPTAATNIQDAVDVAVAGDQILVTNGVYQTGGRVAAGITNRVAVTKPVTVQSVNGPTITFIQGHQVFGSTNGLGALRCVYLTNGATLVGFTLTNGATSIVTPLQPDSGGGVFCASTSASVSNCVLTGNSAYGDGGGAYSGTLNNCILTGNVAWSGGGAYGANLINCQITGNYATDGGGAFSSQLYNCLISANSANRNGGGVLGHAVILNNCTITGNSAGVSGGGVHEGTLNNCIVYFNSVSNVISNYGPLGMAYSLNYCCTTPLPSNGVGSFTNAPLFINTNGWSNLRSQSNSPCINAGNNASATSSADLDGNARISGGTVDIGAYEFQTPASILSYAWAQQYGLPTDGTVDFVDTDGEGANNWQEWRADTNPTNALSVLLMVTATNGQSGLDVSWQSVSTRNYWLERATNLSDTPPFQSIATNILGASGTKTYTDTSATNAGPYFYRVGVQ